MQHLMNMLLSHLLLTFSLLFFPVHFLFQGITIITSYCLSVLTLFRFLHVFFLLFIGPTLTRCWLSLP